MISIFIFGLFTYSVAVAGNENSGGEPVLTWKTDSRQLILKENTGSCEIEAHEIGKVNASIKTGIPWPCSFHVNKKGAIRTLQNKQFIYALIESSRVVDSKNCVTHIQSVRISRSKFEVSKHQERVASCPPFQWDNMMFTELFD